MESRAVGPGVKVMEKKNKNMWKIIGVYTLEGERNILWEEIATGLVATNEVAINTLADLLQPIQLGKVLRVIRFAILIP